MIFDAETNNICLQSDSVGKKLYVIKTGIKDDRWYNLTVVHAKNSGKLQIYFNGVLYEPPKGSSSILS